MTPGNGDRRDALELQRLEAEQAKLEAERRKIDAETRRLASPWRALPNVTAIATVLIALGGSYLNCSDATTKRDRAALDVDRARFELDRLGRERSEMLADSLRLATHIGELQRNVNSLDSLRSAAEQPLGSIQANLAVAERALGRAAATPATTGARTAIQEAGESIAKIRAISRTADSTSRVATGILSRLGGEVFVQYAGAIQQQVATEIQGVLRADGYRVPSVEDVVDDSRLPDMTEVRYFHAEDEAAANAIVARLKWLSQSARSRAMITMGRRVPRARFEVWLGSNVAESDHPAQTGPRFEP